MARPGPGVKRAKMLPADQHRAPSARPEGRADSVGRGRRDNAGLPERHIFSEREVVATENNKAVLHYPGGEFEMDIVKATEGNDGIAIGKLLAETGLTTFDPGYTATTDHTREYVPLIALGQKIRPGSYGTRESFADIAATVADLLGISLDTPGKSFLSQIVKE